MILRRIAQGFAVLALLLSAGPTRAEDKWDFKDPQIATAAFGMLTPLLQKDFCPGLDLHEQRFTEALKLQRFLPEDIRRNCDKCYLQGLSGAKAILDQKGKASYCATMERLFGSTGVTIQGLIE